MLLQTVPGLQSPAIQVSWTDCLGKFETYNSRSWSSKGKFSDKGNPFSEGGLFSRGRFTCKGRVRCEGIYFVNEACLVKKVGPVIESCRTHDAGLISWVEDKLARVRL